MGNFCSKKHKKCLFQPSWRKGDCHSGYNCGCECFEGTKMLSNREEEYGRNANSYQSHLSDRVYINHMHGDLIIHQLDWSKETECSDVCERCSHFRSGNECRKKTLERRIDFKKRRFLRCRQHSNTSLDSGSESDSIPQYSYSRTANKSAENCILKNNTRRSVGYESSFQIETDSLSALSYEHTNRNVRFAGQKSAESVCSDTNNACRKINKIAQTPNQGQMSCKLENKNPAQSGENIRNEITHENNGSSYREPVQIEGSIQQENTSVSEHLKDSRERTGKSSCKKPYQNSLSRITDTAKGNKDFVNSRSIHDSGFVTSNTTVGEACNTDHFRESLSVLNTDKNTNKFENQTNVVSVRTNTVNSTRKINHGAQKSDKRGVCHEFENRPEESGDCVELQTLCKANVLTEVKRDSSGCVSRKNISTENVCADPTDSETTQKHKFDDLRDDEERPGRRLLSETVFDDETDDSDASCLDLRSDSDTEKLVFLKLPGPSFENDGTELKRHDKPPLVMDIEQIPSSGYPFNTSNTDFQVHSHTCNSFPDDSEEESNAFSDTSEHSNFVMKSFSVTSDKAEDCSLKLQQPEIDITNSNASQDRAIPAITVESDTLLIKSNVASDSQGHVENEEEADCREYSCVKFDRNNDSDCDVVNASTTCTSSFENGMKSDSKKVPAEETLVNKCSGSAKHYFRNEAQECTSKIEDPCKRETMLCEKQELTECSSFVIKGNSKEEIKEQFSAPDNAVPSHFVSKLSSLQLVKPRRQKNSESDESDYCSLSSNARSLDSTTQSERKEKTFMKMDIHTNSEGLESNTKFVAVKTSRAAGLLPDKENTNLTSDCPKVSSLKMLGGHSGQGCKNSSFLPDKENTNLTSDCPEVSSLKMLGGHSGQGCKNSSSCECLIFENKEFDYIPVNSFHCFNVLSVIIDRSDESNTRLVKVSDEGILQEIKVSNLIETQIIETDSTTDEQESKRQESQSEKCTNRNRDFDGTYKERNEDDCFKLKQNEISNNKCAHLSNKTDLLDKRSIGDKTFCVRKLRSFSESYADILISKPDRRFKRYSDSFTAVHEFHGFSNKTQDLGGGKVSYASKASSETDLSNMKFGLVEWHQKALESKFSSREDHCNDSDSQLEGHCQFSKTVLPTPADNGKRKKVLKKKRKKTLKPETCSFSSQQSISQTFSGSLSNSYKKSNVAHNKRKGQKSWKRSFARHQRSRKLRSEISWGYKDSGIGVSYKSGSSSIQNMITNYESLNKYLKGKWSVERKIIPCTTKKKSIAKYFQKSVQHFFKRKGKRVTKSVVRNLFGRPTTAAEVRVLETYFQRMSIGSPLSTQERMRYEWLRLATFHNYTGSGNTLALARNGFYHDHEEGPTTTRCYLCDARHSNWELFDDVNAEHRRQSPNCPIHENSGQESVNIPITSGDNEGGASVRARTSAPTVTSVNTTVTLSSTATSSAAAASEAMRSLQIGQASSSGGESISQQPTEDPESRDRSLLALSQPRTQRALGRTGHSYSTIIAPRRNNVATGARSNVGIDPLGSGSTTSGTGSQIPGIRPSSILGGPVGAGAFAGLNRAGQNTDAQPSVIRATEGLQRSNAPSSSTEAAAGPRQTNPAPGAGGRTDPTITVVVDNPKHPDYVNIDSRVSSYQGWPDYLDQTPRQMSEAGFFFVGVADFTRCFCCGGGLRNWEPGDDPMLEHTRWFPRCEYVNKLKGERYVAAVQRRHQEHMAEQQRQQIEIAQRRDENRNPPDPMTTEAAAVMREMGYSAERTREAILAVRQQTGSAVVTTQQVLTWLLDAEERRLTGNSSNTELGIRPPPMSSSTATSIVDTSTPSSIVYTGTSISSSIVYTGTSIDTSVVNTTSSISTATSIVSAGTTISTVSSTSTTATAEVQQTGTPAGAERSGTGNQQTGSGNSSSSNSASGASVEKQSGASGDDSNDSKSAAKEDASSSEPTNKTTKKKNAKKKAKNKVAAKSETAGATGGDIDAKSLKAENEKLREMQTCKICMERAVNTTLLPCGHLVCCDTCAARLQRCPICRKRIKGTVKTFMS